PDRDLRRPTLPARSFGRCAARGEHGGGRDLRDLADRLAPVRLHRAAAVRSGDADVPLPRPPLRGTVARAGRPGPAHHAVGLGQRIYVAISLFHEHQLMTLILTVYVLVTLVDALSAYLRTRLV